MLDTAQLEPDAGTEGGTDAECGTRQREGLPTDYGEHGQDGDAGRAPVIAHIEVRLQYPRSVAVVGEGRQAAAPSKHRRVREGVARC
jgi:hypothetical protein